MSTPAVPFLISAKIDNGTPVIEFQYPNDSGEDEALLAQRMLPSLPLPNDGYDYTYFYLGRSARMEVTSRSSNRRKTTIVEPGSLEIKSLELYLYELNTEGEEPKWDMIGDDVMLAFIEPEAIQIIDESDQSEILTVSPHLDLEFTELEELFACILTETGTVYGMRFLNHDDEVDLLVKVEDMCNKVAKSKEAKKEESQIARYSGSQLSCLAIRKQNVALCLCSKIEYVAMFKPLLELSIEQYAQNPSTETLEKIYEYLKGAQIPKTPATIEGELFNQKFQLQYPPLVFPDQICPVSISTLVKHFKGHMGSIYNCVLTERKVVFYGSKCSAQDLCGFVTSALALVYPIPDSTRQNGHPYTTLGNRFHASVRYVVGCAEEEVVTNEKYWDLLCNVDNGTVTWNSSVDGGFQTESATNPFFERIYYIVSLGVGEDVVQKEIQRYTRRYLDASLGRGYFSKPAQMNEYAQETRRRTLFWAASYACERWERSMEQRQAKDFSIDMAIQKFVFGSQLGEQEIRDALTKFTTTISNSPERQEEVRQIIRQYNALDAIACGLLHASNGVRQATKTFLYNMNYFQPNSELNPLHRMVYQRLNSVGTD